MALTMYYPDALSITQNGRILHSAGDRISPQSLGEAILKSHAVAIGVMQAGVIVFANPAFRDLFKVSGPLIGLPLTEFVADADGERLGSALAAAANSPTTYSGMGLRSGDMWFDLELHIESGTVDGEPTLVLFVADVTERHRSEKKLSYMAFSDPLTGLPNRALFADRLRVAMRDAWDVKDSLAILMTDLDGFKAVNDTHGHEAGDTVLQLVSHRLRSCLRDTDTLARLGGDEFAVLLPLLGSKGDADAIATRMIQALQEPFLIGPYPVNIGISIGIAVYPENATSTDALQVAADTALYRVKRAGKNAFQRATGLFTVEALSMPPMKLGAAHMLGIRDIDEQHTHLAQLVNNLSIALKENADKPILLADVDALVAYTKFHFATEELLMAEFNIASLAPHREAHRRLLDDISNIGVDRETTSVSLILRFLQEWLLRHIDGSDRELARVLLEKGYR